MGSVKDLKIGGFVRVAEVTQYLVSVERLTKNGHDRNDFKFIAIR